MLGVTVMAPWWVRVVIGVAVAVMTAVLTVMAAVITSWSRMSRRLLRVTVIVVFVGLLVLASILCAAGMLLYFNLPGGNAVDLGGIGNWSFRLVSGGLEVSHNARILGVFHLIVEGIAVLFPVGLHVVAAILRWWQARRAAEQSPRPA
ncbi:MAG TPA: hypothetical protein VK797_02840 [Tepidisphaeraceae bacterium]|nr:hypothetical protein [Tepidisphaeraceae bacterium]